MIKAVNIEKDEKAIEAVQCLSSYCREKVNGNCRGCFMLFSQVCILKWTAPEQWDEALAKVMERRAKR